MQIKSNRTILLLSLEEARTHFTPGCPMNTPAFAVRFKESHIARNSSMRGVLETLHDRKITVVFEELADALHRDDLQVIMAHERGHLNFGHCDMNEGTEAEKIAREIQADSSAAFLYGPYRVMLALERVVRALVPVLETRGPEAERVRILRAYESTGHKARMAALVEMTRA